MAGGIVSGGLEAANWAVENRSKIKKFLGNIYRYFEKHQKGILILGGGGTGKSTIGRLLSGEYDFLIDPAKAYEESIGIEKRKLKGKPKIEIVVPPGQQHRREATWTDLHRDIAAGKYRGVVLLSSYGYHSLGSISYKMHKMYGKSNEKGFLQAYIEDRRNDEVAIIRDLIPHIQMNRHPMWLLSAVTKQDLWWPHQTEVHDHYANGAYGSEIVKLLAAKDPKEFRHELVLSSLVIGNFVTGPGELLQKNTAGYDSKLHAESLQRVYNAAGALIDWELK